MALWYVLILRNMVPGVQDLALFVLGESRIDMTNGHATGTDWLEVPTIYKAYF